MKALRSDVTTKGRTMAGARALWRATGVKNSDFGKPIIAIANSFTQFVPGHVHLRNVGKIVAKAIEKHGGIAKEFNTIAVDDGIAMGHSGMLYSLPSRDLIADSVEFMVNAHKADALVCISNCDKVTPGMLMAAMRLNIPTIFVSGGPMEAGVIKGKDHKLDLIDAMVMGAKDSVTDEELQEYEAHSCPTCGSCSGMFTANSMNCLTEALGLALPGNGTLVATHKLRKKLYKKAGKKIVDLCTAYYKNDDESVLPRNLANIDAFSNAMSVDIAMGGSTNTVLHLLAVAKEGDIKFTLKNIDALSKKIPHLCKVAPACQEYHIEDVHNAGGIMRIMSELKAHKLLKDTRTVISNSLFAQIDKYNVASENCQNKIKDFYKATAKHKRSVKPFSQESFKDSLDLDSANGCIRDFEHAYMKDGGLAVLYGNLAKNGAIVKTASVDSKMHQFVGPAIVFESQEEAVDGILGGKVHEGDVVVIRYEGPRGGPGMQEMLYPTSYLKSVGLDKKCALITDGRFSGGSSGLSIGHISPEAANGGLIALIKNGDIIKIDIDKRELSVTLDDKEIKARESAENKRKAKAYTPHSRQREISNALKIYALHAKSADLGGVREIK